MRRARTSISLAACLVSCSAANAQAAPGRFELSWSAPETCPSESAIGSRVERILNRPISVRDDEMLVVHARVQQPDSSLPWRVELETDNGQRRSSRSLEAASCDELANATALLVAILIEPNVEQTQPAPSPAQPRAAPPSRVPVHSPTARPVADAKAPLQLGVGAFGAVLSGLLPAWSFGLGLEGGVAWRALRGNVSVASWHPIEQTAPDSSTQGARFRLISARAELCWLQPLHGSVAAGLCSGADVAFLHAQGFGQGVTPSTQNANFVSISGGGLLTWAASSQLSFLLDANAVVPLGSRRFVFEGSAPVQLHTPRAGLQLGLGLQFWLGKTENRRSGPTTL